MGKKTENEKLFQFIELTSISKYPIHAKLFSISSVFVKIIQNRRTNSLQIKLVVIDRKNENAAKPSALRTNQITTTAKSHKTFFKDYRTYITLPPLEHLIGVFIIYEVINIYVCC